MPSASDDVVVIATVVAWCVLDRVDPQVISVLKIRDLWDVLSPCIQVDFVRVFSGRLGCDGI